MHFQIGGHGNFSRMNFQAEPAVAAGFRLRAPARGADVALAKPLREAAFFEQFTAEFAESSRQRGVQCEA